MNNKFSFLTSEFKEAKPIEDNLKTSKKAEPKAKKKEEVVLPIAKHPEASPEAEAKETTPAGRRGGKRSDPGYKVVGVQLPIALHRKAKELLLRTGDQRNFSDLMTQLLQEWVESGDV